MATRTAGVTVRAAVPGMSVDVGGRDGDGPGGHPGGQSGGRDGGRGRLGRRPGDAVGQVLRAQVGVGAGGRELLGLARRRWRSTGGVTTMVTSTAGVTVRAAVPGMSVDGSVAVMVTAPVATPVASPVEEMVAVACLRRRPRDAVGQVLGAQVGVGPGGRELLGLARADGIHRRRHGDGHQDGRGDGQGRRPRHVDGRSVAVMVTAPVATPVASPVEEIVAVAALDDDQVTLSVRFFVLRSE